MQSREFRAVRIERGPQGWGGPRVIEPTAEKDKVMAVFFLTNPMVYTFGTFLEERYKPAFYDSAVSFVHPPLGLFPHVNPGELFVWLGVAEGIRRLDLPLGDLAVRYLLAGLVVIFIRGLLTQVITQFLARRQGVEL